jgi:hypothetical protein
MLSKKQRQKSTTVPHPLGRPFLIGFDASRSTNGIYLISEESGITEHQKFAQEVYRYFNQQGIQTHGRVRYHMCHDKYSLGVIPLEIGLWMLLEKGKSLREIREKALSTHAERGITVREALVKLAADKLNINMERKYTKVMLECLHSKSEDNYVLSDFIISCTVL